MKFKDPFTKYSSVPISKFCTRLGRRSSNLPTNPALQCTVSSENAGYKRHLTCAPPFPTGRRISSPIAIFVCRLPSHHRLLFPLPRNENRRILRYHLDGRMPRFLISHPAVLRRRNDAESAVPVTRRGYLRPAAHGGRSSSPNRMGMGCSPLAGDHVSAGEWGRHPSDQHPPSGLYRLLMTRNVQVALVRFYNLLTAVIKLGSN